MQHAGDRLLYSASDLNDYLECTRLTGLASLVARGMLAPPDPDEDLTADLIRRKGEEHERRHLETLRETYPGGVVEFGRSEPGVEAYRLAEKRTVEAMQSGAQIIYQATFFDGEFIGHADFLRRVERPSELGSYGYEVIDTKLGLSPKPYYLVQLCNYSEHVQRLQGVLPESAWIVLGDDSERAFRLSDYMAYYRHLKQAFLRFAGASLARRVEELREYPFVRPHCRICDWNDACVQKRIADDHLSLVAGMRRDQIVKFEEAGIARVFDLAGANDAARPTGMTPETFAKLGRQASLQVRGRETGEPLYDLLAPVPATGFALLPEPAAGDVFFDMEGDPLFEPGRSLEYLFGCWMPDDDPPYRAFWGCTPADERKAFEDFVDLVVERRRRYPAMHVYHYAPYEKTALRRLAQEHCTREDEVDDLLRAEVLVDLFATVRQTLVISEDGYGLKKLEKFYGLKRETEVKKGDESIVMFERWLLDRDDRILADIQAYNQDDCRSTFLLREWLLARRLEAERRFGIELPLREPRQATAPCHAEFVETCKDCIKRRAEEREAARRTELERVLAAGIAAPQSEEAYRAMEPGRRSRYLLSNLLAYHRREAKPAYWAYFDQCENVDQLLEFYKDPIAGLRLRDDIEPVKIARSLIYTYEFPAQTHKMSPGEAHDPRTQKAAGTIVRITEENLLELKTTAKIERARAITELIPGPPPRTPDQKKALERIAEAFLDGSIARRYPAANDILTANYPRSRGSRVLQPAEVNATTVSDAAQALDQSYLFVQGPPGSGKTTIGAAVICDLIQRGRRVALTSTGHKAIHNLLHAVEETMARRGGAFRGLYKHSRDNEGSEFVSRRSTAFVTSVPSNDDVSGTYDLAAGTAWLLTREEMDGVFDYLFIDEAGQVSLADALALSTCARNVVLLGDPSQLAQVDQGAHPLHVGDSVLTHLLGEDRTVAPERGIFLDRSYRMQPEICAFISETMYDGRLQPAPQTNGHRVSVGGARIPGLSCVPVEHDGNGGSSEEEAVEIVRQISLLLAGGAVVDSKPPELAGRERPLEASDVIVVTPYNAQRHLLVRKLREAGIASEVGTVDKFQGQEAAVVFYSMATSSGDHLPRNMEFLFERNRFNVAISRARAASMLVYSPRLLDVSCRTPEQMALVNLLCEFVERAASSAL